MVSVSIWVWDKILPKNSTSIFIKILFILFFVFLFFFCKNSREFLYEANLEYHQRSSWKLNLNYRSNTLLENSRINSTYLLFSIENYPIFAFCASTWEYIGFARFKIRSHLIKWTTKPIKKYSFKILKIIVENLRSKVRLLSENDAMFQIHLDILRK